MTALMITSEITADKAGESAWISIVLSMIVGLIELGIIYNLGMRFPRKTLSQYSEILLGKTLGKILSFAYVVFFMALSIFVSRLFTSFITVNLMPETPTIVFYFFLTLMGAYAVSKEIEVIARMAQFILPIAVFALSFLVIFPILNADFSQLLPLFDKGVSAVLRGSLVPSVFFGEIIILVFLMPLVNKPQEVLKKGCYSIVAAGLFITLITAITVAVFGPEQTRSLAYPFLHLAKAIKILGIQRLEYFVIFIWVSGLVVKIAVLYYVECFALVKLFSLRDKRIVILIVGIMQVFLPNYLFKTPFQVAPFINIFWPPVAFLFELVIPLGLLFLAIIKRKKVRRLD
ncbi:spore germination protein [Dehalobacter sp. DCM]|nr:spore germination protein [Dehalobacter sp. DCM]